MKTDFPRDAQVLANELAALLTQKHKRYGSNPLLKGGWPSVVNKLEMKLERLSNLLEHKDVILEDDTPEQWASDVHDQLIDIAGYALLGKIYFQELNAK